MNKDVLLAALGILIVIFLVVGGIVYSKMDTRLTEAYGSLSKMEDERDDLAAELEAKEKDLVSLEEDATLSKKMSSERLEEIQRLYDGIEVIGECLTGVVNAMDAINREDRSGAFVILLPVVEPCKRSSEIIEEVKTMKSRTHDSHLDTSSARTSFR
jgi:hypothetical protein